MFVSIDAIESDFLDTREENWSANSCDNIPSEPTNINSNDVNGSRHESDSEDMGDVFRKLNEVRFIHLEFLEFSFSWQYLLSRKYIEGFLFRVFFSKYFFVLLNLVLFFWKFSLA